MDQPSSPYNHNDNPVSPSTALVPTPTVSGKPPLAPIHITNNTNNNNGNNTMTPYPPTDTLSPSSSSSSSDTMVVPNTSTTMATTTNNNLYYNHDGNNHLGIMTPDLRRNGGMAHHLETDSLFVMEITLASRPDSTNNFHPPFATFNRTFRHLSRGQVLAIARGGGKFIGNTILNGHHHNHSGSSGNGNTNTSSTNNKKSGVHSYLGFRDLYRAVGPGESAMNRNKMMDNTSLLLSDTSKFARATLTPRKGCVLVALAGQSGLITPDRALIFLEAGDDGRIQEFMSLLNQSVMGGEGPTTPEPLPVIPPPNDHSHHHHRTSIFHHNRPNAPPPPSSVPHTTNTPSHPSTHTTNTTPHPAHITHIASVPAYMNDLSSQHATPVHSTVHRDSVVSSPDPIPNHPPHDSTLSPSVLSPGGSNSNVSSSNTNPGNVSHGLFPTGLSFEYHILASLLRAASANLSLSLQNIEKNIQTRVLPQNQRGAPTETHYGLIADAEAKVADFLHSTEAILSVVTDVLEEEEDIESMALSTPSSVTVPVPMSLPKLPTPTLNPITVPNTTTNNLGSSMLRSLSSSITSPSPLTRSLSTLSPSVKIKPSSPSLKSYPVTTITEISETSEKTNDTDESMVLHSTNTTPLNSNELSHDVPTHHDTTKNTNNSTTTMEDHGPSLDDEDNHTVIDRQLSNVTEEVLRNTSHAAEIAAEAANQAANQAAAAAASTTGALAAAVLMMRALSVSQNGGKFNTNGSRMEDFRLPSSVYSAHLPSSSLSTGLSHPPSEDHHHHPSNIGSSGSTGQSTDPGALPSSSTTGTTTTAADAQVTAMSTMLEVLQGGTGGSLTMNMENPAWREEIIAIEELLEWFVAEIEHIVGQGKYLATLLAGERQSMSLVLATNRNRLLLIQIAIQSLTMGMALCSLVSGYFGMNLTNPINERDLSIAQYWLLVVFLSFLAGIILVLYFYTIAWRIAGSDPTKDKKGRIFLSQI